MKKFIVRKKNVKFKQDEIIFHLRNSSLKPSYISQAADLIEGQNKEIERLQRENEVLKEINKSSFLHPKTLLSNVLCTISIILWIICLYIYR